MELSHFEAMLLFALLVSVAFAFLVKRRMRDRWRYAAWSLFLFLAAGIGAGWLMYWFQK